MWRGIGSRRFVACAVALMTIGACGPRFHTLSEGDLASVRAWLNCDDCAEGEREAVRALGDDAIPVLFQALFQTPDQEVQNLRAQYSRLYAMRPPAGVDSATFVNRYLGTRRGTANRRAAISLGDLEARGVLQQAADSLEAAGDSSLAAFVRGQIMRSGPVPSLGNGTATAWAMVTPAVGVTVCNGLTTTPCSRPGAAELAARADGPSGTFANPWARVYFYGRLLGSSDPPELLRVVSAVAVTDDGVERHYTWSARFGAHGWQQGIGEVFAVGVDASGERYRTPSDTLITIVNGR